MFTRPPAVQPEFQFAVVLDNVTKKYAGKCVIKGISLEIPNGELTIITGRSGSGKSTLLRMMQAIESPDTGTVTLLGHELSSLSEKARGRMIKERVGVGFQTPNLDGNFTTLDNLQNTANAKGHAVSSQRIAELATLFGLQDKLFQNAATLSGGEQARVAIGRALIGGPEGQQIALLDESTASLDTASSRETLNIFRDIVDKEKETIVMVTHDADVAREFAHNEFVIESGELAQTFRYGV